MEIMLRSYLDGRIFTLDSSSKLCLFSFEMDKTGGVTNKVNYFFNYTIHRM